MFGLHKKGEKALMKEEDSDLAQINVRTIPSRYYDVQGKLPSSSLKKSVLKSSSDGSGGRKKVLLIVGGFIFLALLSVGVVIFTTPELFNKNIAIDNSVNKAVVAKLSANKNTNAAAADNNNKNANIADANVNTQVAANKNINAADNTNAAANVNQNTDVAEGYEIAAAVAGKDSDKDGLSDQEELLYGSDSKNMDTDGDSYVDGSEVAKGYSPIVANVKISAMETVKEYKSSSFQFAVLHPQSWSYKISPLDSRSVSFDSGGGEFIVISVQDNSEKLTIEDWLKKNIGSDFDFLAADKIKSGDLLGVKSTSGYDVYFDQGEFVYVFSYKVGQSLEINFKSTFEMMVNSFRVLGS